MAILQLHNRHKFIQPSGFSLSLLAPDVTKVDGMADELGGGVILGGDVFQLGQTTVHLHGDALGQGLRFQLIQRQKQLVRMGGVYVLVGVREAHPHAVHVGSAGQLDPDRKIAFVGIHRRVTVQKRID